MTALLAVAAVIVTVRLAGSTDKARLRAARLEIESTLRRARQFTASRHRPAWLEIDCGMPRIRAAWPESEGIIGTWKTLDRVRVSDVEIGNSDVPTGQPIRIRVTAAGVTLPWRAMLESASVRVRITSDGIRNTVQVDSTLDASGAPR